MGDIKARLNASNCQHYKRQIEGGPKVSDGTVLIVILWGLWMATVFMCTYVAHHFIGHKSWKKTRNLPFAMTYNLTKFSEFTVQL